MNLIVPALLFLFPLLCYTGNAIAADPPPKSLYNGIPAPEPWPPERKLNREPQPVPYLVNPPQVIPIDVGRQLFVDNFLIEQTNLTRTFHAPVPHQNNPIVRPDRKWEGAGLRTALAMPFSDGVWYDPQDKLFKMWYAGVAPEGLIANQPKGGMVTCYATSKDGLTWEKPTLDVVPGTNIVLAARRDSTTVWLDERDPARRYSLVRTYRSDDDKYWATSVHFSSDGIHWSDTATSTKGLKWFGDRTTSFFNPFRNVWVYSSRNTIRHDPEFLEVRVRHYNEHPDLADGLQTWERHPWLDADRLDRSNPRFPDFKPQLYNVDGVGYESIMLGLFSVLEGPENDVCKELNIHKRNEVFVAFSRDGFHWDRTNRRPFIGVNETDGAWNWGNVQSVGGGCVIVGDELYFFYSGRQRSIAEGRGPGSTGLATLRRDGFASMDVAGKSGTLTTRPLVFSGRDLFVNADTRAGDLRVEVLDEAGKAIAPFTVTRCRPIHGDGTKQRVQWRGAADLRDLAQKPVRFRFHLSGGSLYAFWVSPDKSGASRGYVAAGGPGFRGSKDAAHAE